MCAGMCTRCPAPWSKVGQPLRAGKRALGARRRLHGMDIVVAGAGMIGVDRQHPLERGHDLLGPPLGPAFGRPVIPGLLIHQRFGVERAGWSRRRDTVATGIRSWPRHSRIQFRACGVGCAGIAGGECLDIRSFPDSPAPPDSRPPGRPRRLLLLRSIHRQIDVRPQRQGDSPMGHRGLRIEPRGLPE
jgi:hypothetical protein